MVKQAGWKLLSLDCVVCCEAPKLLPFRDNIRRNLAQALEVSEDAVFVKGKTAEGLGPVGKGKAVEAQAVCLLKRG
jgi:2-C-methyl-D-erythritol 2,4-cyclodiphosphate synthase